MIYYMNEGKKILEPILVGTGTLTTGWLAWFDSSVLSGAKDFIAILVGLATLVYTIYKIMEIRAKRRKRLEAEAGE